MSYFNFKNGVTKLNATNLNEMQKGLMKLVFPIGNIYITQDNTNPSEILGFGTWERLKGKVCLGLDEDDTDMNAIGKTGGEKRHTLTVAELAKHSHPTKYGQHDLGLNEGQYGYKLNYSIGCDASIGTQETGGGQAHNNMQPYEIVGYMWYS